MTDLVKNIIMNKPPLILVHGWGMNNAVWTPFLPFLEDKYEVHCLELLGHGKNRSSKEIGQTLESWAMDVLAQAPQKAHWIGWSLGAQVVIKAALMQPERFQKIVILTGTPCFMAQDNWACGMPEKTLHQFSQALFKQPNKTIERFLLLQVLGSKNEAKIYKALKTAFEKQVEPAESALKIGLELLKNTDLRPQLSELIPKIFWLFGGKDTLVSKDCATILNDLKMPYQIIDEAGHAPFLSHPKQTFALIQDFLNG